MLNRNVFPKESQILHLDGTKANEKEIAAEAEEEEWRCREMCWGVSYYMTGLNMT